MADLKLELHQMIDQIGDKKTLEAVYTLLSNQTVAYNSIGKSLSRSNFELMIDEGEKDIKEGRVFSQEDVEAHFKSQNNG